MYTWGCSESRFLFDILSAVLGTAPDQTKLPAHGLPAVRRTPLPAAGAPAFLSISCDPPQNRPRPLSSLSLFAAFSPDHLQII